MRKNLFFAATAILALTACRHSKTSQAEETASDSWQLVWEEKFDGVSIDSAVWSKIPRGPHDWNNTMSDDDRLFQVKDGYLTLRGVVNDFDPSDESPFLTAGVETRGKKSFNNGRLEIRARLQGAQGAWPAIWLMPQVRDVDWPTCGEIDIMERLNFDPYAYQTVHSDYTYTKGNTQDPRSSATGPIDPDDFNVYGVEISDEAVNFFINDSLINSYPRLDPAVEGQYPFANKDWYLMLDMQLGGNWVGEVNPADLPTQMDIDWVKYYQK